MRTPFDHSLANGADKKIRLRINLDGRRYDPVCESLRLFCGSIGQPDRIALLRFSAAYFWVNWYVGRIDVINSIIAGDPGIDESNAVGDPQVGLGSLSHLELTRAIRSLRSIRTFPLTINKAIRSTAYYLYQRHLARDLFFFRWPDPPAAAKESDEWHRHVSEMRRRIAGQMHPDFLLAALADDPTADRDLEWIDEHFEDPIGQRWIVIG
jgi:hypothetical protein